MQHPLSATLAHQGRSESWLGRMTEKSASYVHRVIKGERRPSTDFMRRSSVALGVPETILFPAVEPDEAPDPEAAEATA